MSDFLAEWYQWIKAVHLIGAIAWMAGMLYLPRLYVYHADAEPGSVQSETFKVMERRLLRAIINPAMMVACTLGIAMLFTPGVIDWSAWWIWVKLFCVFIGLGTMHAFLARWRKDFEADRNTRPAKFYRMVNEVPTLFMIVTVIMVIVRPF
ncbi:MAG: protoporphyrinogen oxidase HemJ [Alphaproteobacteria bacterium]|nr:protoporphyrinogen oxidase HemJ [Alphaproteobacteria bacterium]MDP6565036.1 protoporphyrinogen oxidase HemJ [Alphaproteobacteria bacterium]MDP6816326.1 protoporphyrinogen oxidase HemJ [Alphaproteobacteria bacterium]